MANQTIKILIADDHPRVREALHVFLELWDDFEVIGEAATGDEAIRLSKRLQPDVILMDIIMPQVDGVDATRIIRRTFPQIRIILMTSSVDHDPREVVQKSGASAYLPKNGPAQEFEAIIRKVVSVS
ncbi:MAG: response regulator transcription factor [Anaerolineae bacterium]|nr:response regulator transcription factor [Anaerolineae bacterium]